jgi:ATP-binding cassette subfamily B protein
VKEAAKQAQLDDFISTLEEGYNTLVGERGLRLSGGQKQRVALARAVIKHPALICLDEATSALDSQTENQILGTIIQIAKTCTTVIISHRMSTVRHADSILVLAEGEIKEAGTHDSLMTQQGLYCSMVQRQHSHPEDS